MAARVLLRNEGITRVFTRKNKFLTRLPVPAGPKRWIALAAPVAAALALSMVPLAASNAATPSVSGMTRMGGASAPARPASALPVMTFKMNGKTVSIGGTLKSGAERILFTVTHEPQGGSPGLVRIDNGVSLSQFFKNFAAAGQDPNNLYGVGQIVMNTQANPGTSSVFVNLTPGTYVALDLSGTGQPPFTVFHITKAKHPAALPKPGATIASIEFGLRGATVLRVGEMVRWANSGFLVHMIVGAQAPNLATARKIAALLKAGNDNAAQKLAIGFYGWDGALSHGQSFQSVISQAPGFWVIACFMDTQDGREHTTLGMERVIQILK
jgi:hypothetical protein